MTLQVKVIYPIISIIHKPPIMLYFCNDLVLWVKYAMGYMADNLDLGRV